MLMERGGNNTKFSDVMQHRGISDAFLMTTINQTLSAAYCTFPLVWNSREDNYRMETRKAVTSTGEEGGPTPRGMVRCLALRG